MGGIDGFDEELVELHLEIGRWHRLAIRTRLHLAHELANAGQRRLEVETAQGGSPKPEFALPGPTIEPFERKLAEAGIGKIRHHPASQGDRDGFAGGRIGGEIETEIVEKVHQAGYAQTKPVVLPSARV